MIIEEVEEITPIRYQQIKSVLDSKPIKKGANSERAEITSQVCMFLDGDYTRFGMWLGRTKHLSSSQLYQMMSESKSGRNPQALFCYLLKENNTTQKK